MRSGLSTTRRRSRFGRLVDLALQSFLPRFDASGADDEHPEEVAALRERLMIEGGQDRE